MGKWKRSGADALREYENTTNYAYNQGANTLTQGKKPTRWGTDALYEYEQGGGLERAYENYKAAVLERQRRQQEQAALAQNQQTKRYQQQTEARKTEMQNYAASGASSAAKNTAYENYKYALMQQELLQKQQSGKVLTAAEKNILNSVKYKNPAVQEQNDQTSQKVAQATVEKVKASDVLTRQEFFKDAQVAGENGTYKDYMQRQYDSASIEAMQEQSDALAAQIAEQEQKIRDRQTAMGEVTSEESQARQEEMKRKIASGELESTDEMEAQLAALQQEKTLLDQKRALKRGDVALGALDEETLGLLDEYVHGSSVYVREHAKGYNKAGQSKKSARQDLIAKGYTEDEIKKLAEFYERREDYESATAEYAQMQEAAANASGVGEAALSAATALGTPLKALGNIESVRGVLPSWLGGYQNEDMPTNIYSGLYRPVRVSSAIRSGTMADMGATGQFLYQAGMSALDSAVNMGLSVGLVGAAGLSGSAAQSAVASTMNWVMGSQVAADSVYQGIQSGKSNSDALIDGIVEGAIEGITEKYSVGDIIENLLSGKAVWRKIVRAFASEGAEEVASNWLNRLYDVTLRHDRSEILQTFNAYLKQGMSEKEALEKTLGDFAKEDGLSFLAGGLSGWAMSGTYQLFGDLSTEANVQSAAAWAIENGRVQDVIDIGLAQGEGKAYEQAAKMQEKVDAGQTPTQGEAASVLREYAKTQRERAEDAQGGKPEQEDKTYQTYKNAVQEAERAQAAFEAAQQGKDLYDEQGRLVGQSDARTEIYAAEEAGKLTREEADAALNALDAEQNATQPEQEDTQRHKDAMTARERLTAQRERAEEEFERTALEQEKAVVKKTAEDQGLPRQYANTAMMGYTAYKSAGGEMSAAEYAGAVTGAYQAGMDGRSLNAARSAAEGVQGKIIDAVWNAGKRAAGAGEVQKNSKEAKINETGKAAADDGGKRNGGMDSGKQSGRMAEGTGTITEKSEKRRAAEERSELENRVGAAGQPYLSGKEIGIANGSTEKTLREVPKSAYTQSLLDAEAELRQAGVENVHFFIGRIGVVNQASQVRRFAEGAATGGEVWVRADSRTFTAAQLARHEAFHVMAEGTPALLETVRQQITSVLSEEEVRTLAKRYAEAYAGCYTENELELYIAEICADAYAGMARFGEVSQRAAQAVAQQQSRAQNVQKNSSPRGPPQTRYSISETENSSRAETQREITKRYRQTVHEILNGKKNVDGALLVGYTPEVYQKLGMPDLPFVVGSGHVYSMAKTASEAAADGRKRKGINYHGLGESVVADIMEFVKDPVMVIAAKDVDANVTPMRSTHSIVALIDVGIGKNSLVIPVAITAERTVDGVRMDVNAISSAYERDTTALVNEAIAQFNTGENSVFYVKKEAANLLGAGVQFPERLKAAASSDGIVRKFDSKINMSVKNVTESQQFKRWFGDWQNHPERASKVVNADGTPKVMYHGTSAEFTVFDRSQGKKKVHLNVLGEGNYFTARQSAAARYGNNVMEAYLDIKNPYVFDTHSYNTVADQYAAEFGVERSTFTGRDVARMLQGRGYDGVVGYDADGEVVIANAFTSNRIKSATDNAGTFDRSNPDIRFSVSMEQETDTGEAVQTTEQTVKKEPKPELTLDTIPKKAQNYLRGSERNLLYQLERNLRMPLGQSVKEIRTELDGLVNTYLKTGGISERTTQETFERVWDKAMETERALYEKTRPAVETLRRMELTLTEAEKASIGDYAAFEKRMRGKVRVGEAGGVSLDEVYQRMRKAVPELFPNVIAPAKTEQFAEENSTEETKKSSKVSKAERQEMLLLMGINRMDQIAAQVESADGENAEVWKARAKNDFSVCVRDMVADLRIARRYAEAAMREKEAQNAPRTVDEAMELYHTAANQLRDYEREARKWLLTKEDQKIVNMLLRGDITEKSVREKPNAEAILAIYAAKADYDVTMLKIAEWNKTIAEQRVKRARAALGDVQNYKDKKYGIQYQRETQKRNVYDIAPEENAEKINREYFEPVRHASAEAEYNLLPLGTGYEMRLSNGIVRKLDFLMKMRYYINNPFLRVEFLESRGDIVPVCYNNLWKLLIDKDMNKTELKEAAGISFNVMARMGKNETISVESIEKICSVLHCNIGDVIEIVPDTTEAATKKLPTTIELFAGAGGLALGIEKAGFETIGLIELDKDASDTLRRNRPKWRVINDDIANISCLNLPDYFGITKGELDLLSGGAPCQSFSYAGKRLGLEDARGTLFYHYAKFLEQLQPKMFLFENVRGLLTHDKGRTYKTIIDIFESTGYTIQKKVLNAWDYGVAQKRERLITIGIRNDLVGKISFGFPEPHNYKPVLRDILLDCPESEGTPYSDYKRKIFEMVPPGGYWRDIPEDVAKEYMKSCWFMGGGRTGILRRLSLDEPSLAVLTSPSQKQTDRCHPLEARPFTIRENARCQSFPDDWQFCGSIGQQYKQVGNAVPVNLAYDIALKIKEALECL